MSSAKAKTQIQVVQDFLDGATEGRSGSGGNLIIEGDQLIHYQTVIAERYGDKIILNYSRYSIVTGRIQKAIKKKGVRGQAGADWQGADKLCSLTEING